jgi:hypothetical protein
LGPDHPLVGLDLFNVGNVYLATDDYAAAEPLFRRSLAIAERAFDGENPAVADSLVGLGETVWFARGGDEAVPLLHRALAIRETHDVAPEAVAFARWLLGRALFDSSPDRAHARELIEQAEHDLRAAGPNGARPLAAVDAWLAEHPR